MPVLIWHNYLMAFSFIACVLGLSLLFSTRPALSEETELLPVESTEHLLLRLVFSYWMVYCAAIGIEKLSVLTWDVLVLSVRVTAIASYMLTFACVMTLPLHHIAERQSSQDS